MLYYPPPEHTTDMSNGSIPRRPGRPRKPENSNDADMLMRVSNLICLAAVFFFFFFFFFFFCFGKQEGIDAYLIGL